MGDKLTSSSSAASSSSLAPGFRFHPTDEELVIYYLKRKVCGRPFRVDAISDIDIYKFEPWDLPDRSKLKSRDLEWYFFSGLDKKYGNGWRTNRATDQGYWKTTGKDRSVSRGSKVVGMKKTLVFHIGRAPSGERTNWVMHEYRLVDDQLTQAGIQQDAFVLCRVFRKSGAGPKNGEKYGAPFVEEEWDDWEDNVVSLKNEGANDGYYGLPEDDYNQPHQYLQYDQSLEEVKEEHAVAVIPNTSVVGSDGSDQLKHPGTYSGEGQNVYVSTGENDSGLELPDENAFVLPEQFEMDGTTNENEYFTLDDFLNPAYDDPVEGEFTFSDVLLDQPVVDGSLLAFDGPNVSGVDQNAAQTFDDCLSYFDAIDDSNIVGFESSQVSDVGVPYWDESVFTEENTQTGMPLPESPETCGNEGASSSEKQPEISKIAGDVKYDQGWDNSIAKQVSRMLGSFPAPTAYAAEIPTKEVAFGQNSAPPASTTVHVTAGMIHISGMAVFGGEKIWSMGKRGNADLILPYRMTLENVNVIGTSTLSSKATGVILRGAFYFMFFWVLFLSMSCKIGSFIYTKQYL